MEPVLIISECSHDKNSKWPPLSPAIAKIEHHVRNGHHFN